MSQRSDFLERLYFHELERKQSLESMFALPSGIIAGLFGLIGYYFTKFNFGLTGDIEIAVERVFLASALVSLGLLTLSAYWCARAVTGSEYEHLPGAETMMHYWDDLSAWHSENSPQDKSELSKLDFENFLEKSLASCCQKNWKTNLYRSEELFRAKRAIVLALFFVAMLSLCYYINFWISPTELKGAAQ